MLFTIVTILVLAGAFLGLAAHRFWTTREEARSTILYAEIAKKFSAWLALRAIQMSRQVLWPDAAGRIVMRWFGEFMKTESRILTSRAAMTCAVFQAFFTVSRVK